MNPDNLETLQTVAAQKPAAGQGQERTDDAPQVAADPTPEELQKALVDLVRQFEKESDIVRRHHVRRFLQAEEYWKGNQHLIWSDREFRWSTPFEYALNAGIKSGTPKYQYVTNIYQSFGLTIIAAVSQKLPKVRFTPKSAKSERDIATAKAASDVAELIEDNNCLDLLSVRMAYLLWTQGMFGAYVRYKVDKEYGTRQVPVLDWQPVQVAPDRFICPQCGAEVPADSPQGGLAPMQGQQCPTCGYQLDETHFAPAEMGESLTVTGTREYPNGQETISIIGGLNLKLMPQAETWRNSAYLIWTEEQHQAGVRAAYPDKANKIGKSGMSGGTAEDTYERNARMALADSPPYKGNAAGTQGMVTFTRAWLRAWAFYAIDEESIRKKLLSDFPDGAFVAIANDEFLEARNENADEHWEICTPMPGNGMYREAIGGSTISVQQRLNDAHNVIAEHVEFGSAPPVLFDSRYINREALANRKMEPASFFPVVINSAPAGTDISKMMFQPKIQLDANIYSYGKDLIELTQVVSGAMPSLFGGSIQNVDTAAGYNMAREQSLGKLNLFWRAVKQFQARLMLKAVLCFKENRTQDYELVVEGKSGDFASKFIHLEDLKGAITAKPEADEDFPATWAEIRENITNMISQMPDLAGQILMDPANATMIRKFIANPDLSIPGEDDREKQYREIDLLLQAAPTEELDPMSGMPTGNLTPSIMPDPMVDNHQIHIQTLKEFAVSDKGIEAKNTNPAGYSNLMAHLIAHLQATAIEQQTIAQFTGGMMPGVAPQDGAGEPAGAAPTEGTDGSNPPQTVGDKVEQAAPGVGDAISQIANATVQ